MESAYLQPLIIWIAGGQSDIRLLPLIVLIVLLIAGSALMSAAEAAYFSFRKENMSLLRTNKSSRAKTAMSLYSDPEKLLGTILAANNGFNIAIIFVSVFTALRLFSPEEGKLAGFIISLIVVTLALVFFGEIMPKVYASKNTLGFVLLMAYPLAFLTWMLRPLTWVILSLSSMFRKSRIASVTDDFNAAVNGGQISPGEDEKLLRGITNFGNTNVSAIMCPRIDVTAIDIKWGFDKIIPVIINSGFSRIPVYSGSFDTVKGILYAKDVLPYTNNPPGFKWQSLLRPSYFVPETKKINDLLKEFQMRKIHMAIVIDEYGGTSGIVTLEDILEEIVGDITDESDEDETLYRKAGESSFIFEGKILIHDFCRIVDVDEDVFSNVRGESETLAGLMLELAGEIPQKDQVIKFMDFIFRIESVDRRRIREIRVDREKANE